MTSRKRERARTRKARAKKLPTARISSARLHAMIDEATVDCSDESEQVTGWYTMIEEHLAVPFEATILGVPATVERVDLNRREQIVAICARGRDRQVIPILDLPLQTPLPQRRGVDRGVPPLARRKMRRKAIRQRSGGAR